MGSIFGGTGLQLVGGGLGAISPGGERWVRSANSAGCTPHNYIFSRAHGSLFCCYASTDHSIRKKPMEEGRNRRRRWLNNCLPCSDKRDGDGRVELKC